MDVWIQVAFLFLLPILTGLLLVHFRFSVTRKDATWKIATFGSLMLIYLWFGFLAHSHKCKAGSPFSQILIPAICGFFILLARMRIHWKVGLAILFMVVGWSLSSRFHYLVHNIPMHGVVGTKLIEVIERDDLGEALFDPKSGRVLRKSEPTIVLWHTWLTGLYGYPNWNPKVVPAVE